MTDLAVVNNEAETRFEFEDDGHRDAHLAYRIKEDRIILVHTEVPERLSGQGLGSQLVRFAVEHAERNGLALVPRCPFARSWLAKHRPAETYAER